MSIAPRAIAPIEIGLTPETKATPKVDVGNAFANALTEASAAEKTSLDAAQRFANGDPSVGIHEVMIASEQANISLKFATTLKNKALDAYRELMSTQV